MSAFTCTPPTWDSVLYGDQHRADALTENVTLQMAEIYAEQVDAFGAKWLKSIVALEKLIQGKQLDADQLLQATAKRTKRLVTKSKAFPAAKASEASQALHLLSLFKDLALPLGGMVEQDGALLLAFCDAGFFKLKIFFTWCLMLCIKESWYSFQILKGPLRMSILKNSSALARSGLHN